MFSLICSKAKYTFQSFAKALNMFFVEDGWLMCVYTIVIFLPEVRRYLTGLDVLKACLSTLPFSFVGAALICGIGWAIKCLVGRLWGATVCKGWHVVCHVVVYVVAFLEICLYNAFGLRLDHETFFLVLQTNQSEAQEFVGVYLLDASLLISLLEVVGLGVAEWLVLRWSRRCNVFSHRIVLLLIVAYLGVGMFTCRYLLRAVMAKSPYVAFSEAWRLNENSYVRMCLSAWLVKEQSNVGKVLDQHIGDTRVNSQTQYRGNIVLIIGESHTKRHSSLYEYNKDTNPWLGQMRDSLCVYEDVITYVNHTRQVMQEMLSVSSADDSVEWNHVPLFPAVFKQSGWNVVWCSNQIGNKVSSDIYNAALDAFLNTPKVSATCFTARNEVTFEYDAQMVDSFIINRNKALDLARPTLYILQLMGQHMDYKERFPKSQAHFTVADYDDRRELTKSQKQVVADYDNACRYNDALLYKLCHAFTDEDAIVIYLSDHGEEIYDYRDKQGRFSDFKAYAPISYHCQIDVPFVVYMTEAYRHNHPEKVRKVEAAQGRGFMTDDICHMLFYLGDVDSEWFDPARCLIHDEYNANRKRRLHSGECYEDWAR